MSLSLPKFDDLPPVEDMPHGCAWGVFDKDGKNDLVGTLNLLTPEVVRAAAAEVHYGISISLNWPIGSIKIPKFFRKTLEHKVVKLEDPEANLHYGFDDEVEFNTQGSSQWDSFCHFLHLESGKAYNGVKPTIKGIMDPSPSEELKLPTIDHWHERGCVVGRGVLIDFKTYAKVKGIEYSPFSGFRIGIADIEAVAAYQGVSFKPGDILILRFGVTEALGDMTGLEQAEAMASHHACGIEGSKEMARWLWDQHFAAVASDNVAVEAMPPMIGGEVQPLTNLVLHQWCLSLFGMPLGELWYLKTLSEQCQAYRKYTFMLTSSPLNFPGAVGSPPNALAIL
ncbi:cyclase [Penicillium macrosclerotiorum]|uniref:cyclase n=1 Tax=Penicillium macrosclerotiorum TaxID=303699 RepID=UPI0025472642|nr:cyclase [Penicillium macrosclerotiorum]KAJ5668660.1 cyclase [Penicillium macrosclerotiorum]